jgi:hypothetical protein
MRPETLLEIINEIVQKEVKKQVNEQIAKLIKSGVLSYNGSKKQLTTSESVNSRGERPISNTKRSTNKKKFTTNPILNDILNETAPFSADHRIGHMGMNDINTAMGIPTDTTVYETVAFNSGDVNSIRSAATPSVQPTGNDVLDSVHRALNRDYTELVSRF